MRRSDANVSEQLQPRTRPRTPCEYCGHVYDHGPSGAGVCPHAFAHVEDWFNERIVAAVFGDTVLPIQ